MNGFQDISLAGLIDAYKHSIVELPATVTLIFQLGNSIPLKNPRRLQSEKDNH